LSDLGGLASAVMGIFSMVAHYFTGDSYQASLIKALFKKAKREA